MMALLLSTLAVYAWPLATFGCVSVIVGGLVFDAWSARRHERYETDQNRLHETTLAALAAAPTSQTQPQALPVPSELIGE